MRFVSMIGLGLATITSLSAADNYKIDPISSSAVFSVRHFNVANFYGRFNAIDGALVWDAANPAASKITVTIQAGSVDTNNEKRNAHLANPDFFDAKQFPILQFESTSFKPVGDTTYEVSGNYTMHGVTKPITISVEKTGEAKDPKGNMRLGFETKFSIKRSDYGMSKMLENIGDDVHIIFSTEAVKQ